MTSVGQLERHAMEQRLGTEEIWRQLHQNLLGFAERRVHGCHLAAAQHQIGFRTLGCCLCRGPRLIGLLAAAGD